MIKKLNSDMPLLVPIVMAIGLVYLVPVFMPLPSSDVRAPGTAEKSAFQSSRPTNDVAIDTAIERPLFQINRRPPVAQQTAAPVVRRRGPEKPEAPFSLAGIMGATAENRTAYLQNKTTSQAIAVRKGQLVDGWLIRSISSNAVVLERDGNETTLRMSGGR